MVAGAAAGLLLQGLQKSGVQTAMKNFAKATKSMEETEKTGGFDKMKSAMGSIGSVFASPFMDALGILSAKFEAGTTEASMEVFNQLLDLIEKPGVERAIGRFIELINTFLKALSLVTYYIGQIMDFIEQMEGYKDVWDDIWSGGPIMDLIRNNSSDPPPNYGLPGYNDDPWYLGF